jgi:hypothetical protein
VSTTFQTTTAASLDGIAFVVVDLQLGALEVANAQRHRLFHEERVRPSQSVDPCGAPVLAKELEHFPLIRVDHEEPDHQEHDEAEANRAGNDGDDLAVFDAGIERPDERAQDDQ